ncbi:hypothetical protein DdX_10975 [Ditylenchus destructor]|uniref:Uncharacterized protein n=1 Tax=Ditylenchus destructor TaxID=166010 RepID=A0AAD4MY65_9BILA|nr:hypothetical protein DdX_10975 [Ditylenchus destructor]
MSSTYSAAITEYVNQSNEWLATKMSTDIPNGMTDISSLQDLRRLVIKNINRTSFLAEQIEDNQKMWLSIQNIFSITERTEDVKTQQTFVTDSQYPKTLAQLKSYCQSLKSFLDLDLSSIPEVKSEVVKSQDVYLDDELPIPNLSYYPSSTISMDAPTRKAESIPIPPGFEAKFSEHSRGQKTTTSPSFGSNNITSSFVPSNESQPISDLKFAPDIPFILFNNLVENIRRKSSQKRPFAMDNSHFLGNIQHTFVPKQTKYENIRRDILSRTEKKVDNHLRESSLSTSFSDPGKFSRRDFNVFQNSPKFCDNALVFPLLSLRRSDKCHSSIRSLFRSPKALPRCRPPRKPPYSKGILTQKKRF